MKLNVPVIKQQNRRGCGPASLSMILQYFGRNYSEEQIIKALGGILLDKKLKKKGTLAIDNALFARSLGFQVHCYSYDNQILKPEFINLSKPELKNKFKELLKQEDYPLSKKILETYIKLIDSGVDFKIKMPRLVDIKNFLKQKIPVMLAVRTRALYEDSKWSFGSGHYIVISGFDKDKFDYNDPALGKAGKIDGDKLIFALSNNAMDSTAYLIAIKPKQRGRKR